MNDAYLYMLGLISFVAAAFAVALVMVLLLPVGILICLAELIIKKGKFKDL